MTDREAVARYLVAHLPAGAARPLYLETLAQAAIGAGINVAHCRAFLAVLDRTGPASRSN